MTHEKVFFRKSLSKVTFERNPARVSWKLSQFFFFRKKLKRLEHVLFLQVSFASYFRKRLSKENFLVCHYLYPCAREKTLYRVKIVKIGPLVGFVRVMERQKQTDTSPWQTGYIVAQCRCPNLPRPIAWTVGLRNILYSIQAVLLLVIMAALCNRGAIIFLPCDFYLSSIFLLFFIPRLISAAAGWMSTILWHMVWP